MTQYNNLNVKLSNSQLNKPAIKNETDVILRLSSNIQTMKLIFLINYC